MSSEASAEKEKRKFGQMRRQVAAQIKWWRKPGAVPNHDEHLLQLLQVFEPYSASLHVTRKDLQMLLERLDKVARATEAGVTSLVKTAQVSVCKENTSHAMNEIYALFETRSANQPDLAIETRLMVSLSRLTPLAGIVSRSGRSRSGPFTLDAED